MCQTVMSLICFCISASACRAHTDHDNNDICGIYHLPVQEMESQVCHSFEICILDIDP